MVGLVGVAAVISYLVWTGVSDTMVYYLTPVELMERIEQDPSFRDLGVKVSGKVVPGRTSGSRASCSTASTVHDLEDASVTFPVEYRDALPDTFTEDVEVVLEGRLDAEGVFQATTLLTKCGSRYEAAPEDLAR